VKAPATDPFSGPIIKANARLAPRPGRRRSTADRERTIVREAARYFAKHGFDGNTRALAQQLGVSQALLFKYFPSKSALIERIYDEIFIGRWNPAWESWLEDASQSLEERFCRFYIDYARVVLDYEWVRLYMFSSLKGFDLARRYSKILRARIFPCVVAAIRQARGLPSLAEAKARESEIESVASLHAAIFYLGVRQWIYQIPANVDLERAITTKVKAFLLGAPAMFEADFKAVRPAGQSRKSSR
jgi:AcrR family transcriptional regulator